MGGAVSQRRRPQLGADRRRRRVRQPAQRRGHRLRPRGRPAGRRADRRRRRPRRGLAGGCCASTTASRSPSPAGWPAWSPCPRLLPALGPAGMRSDWLMTLALRWMGNLVTDEDRDRAARVWRWAGRRSMPATRGHPSPDRMDDACPEEAPWRRTCRSVQRVAAYAAGPPRRPDPADPPRPAHLRRRALDICPAEASTTVRTRVTRSSARSERRPGWTPRSARRRTSTPPTARRCGARAAVGTTRRCGSCTTRGCRPTLPSRGWSRSTGRRSTLPGTRSRTCSTGTAPGHRDRE